MILIGKVLVSSEILEKKFACNLQECKGYCCCEGYGGAPLDAEETSILEKIFPDVSKYMRKTSIEKIEKQGLWVRNIWGGFEVPLADDGWCVFAVEKQGMIQCAIEIAWHEKKIFFRKPISCHLYPVRLRKFGFFDGLIYEHWNICRYHSGRDAPLLFEFVSQALERKYGKEFVEKLRKTVKW